MILIDTNVVSEIYRPQPNASVLAWLDAQPRDLLYVCTPVLAEMRFGVALLEPGLRKDRLRITIDRIENELYRDRILVFDVPSAAKYGRIAALRQKAGRIMGQLDGLIAAIALANSATLATRNTRDFTDLGLDVINPFEATVDR
jgi:predicted nucleic acid-binding protein